MDVEVPVKDPGRRLVSRDPRRRDRQARHRDRGPLADEQVNRRGAEGVSARSASTSSDPNTSLVEIDLLRGGKPMPLSTRDPVESDYRILISRGKSRPRAKLYAFGVRQPIPAIPIPLLPKDPEPSLDLNAVLHGLYERARFDLVLDYAYPPVPPLKRKTPPGRGGSSRAGKPSARLNLLHQPRGGRPRPGPSAWRRRSTGRASRTCRRAASMGRCSGCRRSAR